MRSSSSSSSIARLLLVSAVCITAASATTVQPLMNYQSFTCRFQPSSPSAATAQTPVPLMTQASEATLTAKTASFLYNLAWGPPNYYLAPGGLANNAVGVQGPLNDALVLNNAAIPTLTNGRLEWSAFLPDSAAANGFPYGCCGGVGAVSVAELGCRNCINTNNLLPNISTVPSVITSTGAARQVVDCSNQQSYQTCTQDNIVLPGLAMGSQATFTDAITTGSSVTTLAFPSSAAGVLAAGVYTFALWAESICGVQASNPVTLAARCPPSPMVLAVLRALPGATNGPSAMLTPNADMSYNVSVGQSLLVDASCSYAFQINKPNWPVLQNTANAALQANFNPTRNLYAIQKVYFSVANPAMTTITGATTVTSTGATFNTAPPLDGQWATTVRFGSAGTHIVVITATDGCSVGQAQLRVNAVCSCQPVAKAMYVPTLWSNVPASPALTSTTYNNLANSGATLSGTAATNTDYAGVPTPLYTFALTASAYDYEVGANPDLVYDWSFQYWVPDYSTALNRGASWSNLGASLAATYLAAPNTNWPPSIGTACSPSGGVPVPCAQGWWGLTADQTGAARCCFSTGDLITDVGTVARPARGSFVYKVLQVMLPLGTARSVSAGTARTKVYSFMRISSGCNTTAPGSFDFRTIATNLVSTVAATPVYYMLPLYLQNAQNGQQLGSSQTYQDFNGYPSVNSGSTAAGPFRPTTECGAWLQATLSTLSYQDVQLKVTNTVSCGRNVDLVLCRVTIAQSSGTRNSGATLSVSSFGSCRGLWQFSLAVDDGCQTGWDYFAINVGCNRPPVVSAGCANTQTWTTSGFEQISLDGRASYDPDNFADSFYSLPAMTDSYPLCISNAGGTISTSNCQNGGLGTYGLTYAWALISYFNANNQAEYISSSSTVRTCPTTPANIGMNCVDAYCTGSWTYPFVHPYTRKYDRNFFWSGVTGTNGLLTSIQGNTTLVDAWQMGFYAVQAITTSTPNTMPLIDNGPTPMTSQPIFPDFDPSCAPTVYPIFFSGASFDANIGTVTTTVQGDWGYAQQIKHVGNSAFMGGLRKAGMYTARLYAFDGCSVGFADVTFTLECPFLQFQDASNVNWNLMSSYQLGNTSVTYVPPNLVVTYSGTQDIVVSGTIAVYPVVSGAANMSSPLRSCNAPQIGTVGAKNVPPASRTLDMSACNGLIYSSAGGGSWLNPGTYVLMATATDGCTTTSSPASPQFTVTCQQVVLTPFNNLNPSGTPNNIARQLTYNVPANGGASGSFPDFVFNLTAEARSSVAGVFNQVSVSWNVFWRPSSNPSTPGTDANGGAGTAFNNFFSSTNGAPNANVFGVHSFTTGSIPSGNIAVATSKIPGGTRTITFPSSTTQSLSARIVNDTVSGLVYNTATDGGQINFNSNRGTGAIFWQGEYYVRVTAAATVAGSSAACPSTGNADQFFTATCAAAVDVTPNVTVTAQEWRVGGNSVFNSLYFNNIPFDTSNNYCPGKTGSATTSGNVAGDSYCDPAGGAAALPNGGFRDVTLTTSSNWNVYGTAPASSVSYRISYKAPFAAAPNATNPAAVAGNNVNFVYLYQNPLLFSPFAYLNLANPSVSTTQAYSANAASQMLEVDVPGTWTVDVFNTNGCANVTGRSIDFAAYCYDQNMPEASLVVQVLTRVPPAGCPGANSTDSAGNLQCDYTSIQVQTCANAAAVRGISGKPTNSFGRRRLLETETEEEHGASRKLLQTAITTGVCALNTNFMPALSSPSFGYFPSGVAAPSTSYVAGSTPILSPNFGAQATVYFNSFDVAPYYFPTNPSGSTGDLRNFYGLGDLFNDGKLAFGVGSNTAPARFQGSFDGVTITVDNSKGSLRGTGAAGTPNANNVVVQWFNFNNWVGSFTMSSSTPLSFATAGTPPAGYSTACSWAPSAALVVDSGNAAYNARSDVSMRLTGCSPFGTGALANLASNIVAVGTAGVSSTSSNPQLVVSVRALDGSSSFTAPANLFRPQASNTFGRTTTVAGVYDYQAIAWNGPIGRACYDYRAVRVTAVCNRLVAFDVTPGNGGNSYRSVATEGPMLVASLVSNPAGSVQKNSPTSISANVTVPVSWMVGMFDGVNVTAGFKYLQCGNTANGALPGGSDPSGVACMAQPGSRDGEGNYYSLRYSWTVVSAPSASVFNPNPSLSAQQGYTLGTSSTVGTAIIQEVDRNITQVNETRTNTYTQVRTTRVIKLLNHGYRNPTTTLRPDVEGTYSLQLTIDDGCSTWQSAYLNVQASCSNLASAVGPFSTFVSLRVGSSAPTASATTAPAGFPADATATAWYVLANQDGSQYNRITMSTAQTTSPNNYWTFMWTVTNVTPGLPGNAVTTIAATNMQGNVASFVPTDLGGDNIPASFDNRFFRVDLTVRSNCVLGDGSMQQTVIRAYIQYTCTLPGVTANSFTFYPAYVNTYSTTPMNFWGFGASTASTFISNFVPASATQQLYYQQNRVVTATGTPGAAPLPCNAGAPYCFPANLAGGLTNIPTILFGGSVPQGDGTTVGGTAVRVDNNGYAKINSVWGAGWQNLYFSVPVALQPNLCKIKKTYWILQSYQNALPFRPQYVPVTQPSAPTCTPLQRWQWTVIATPCQTCTCGTATTCDQADLDTCDFTPNAQYQYQQVNAPTGPTAGASTQIRYNTGYTIPTFNYIGGATTVGAGGPALTNGGNLNPFCVYDAGNRLDSLPNIQNLRANCRVSGRGLTVEVAQGATCAATSYTASATGAGTTISCPMSNIAFVPGFPGAYTLQLSVYDFCGAPQLQTVTVNAQCRLRPAITVLQTAISTFYDCPDPNAGGNWGSPTAPGVSPPPQGKFDPVQISSLIAASGITSVNDTQQQLPTPRTGACSVSAPKTTMNCTDVMRYVNNQNVMVDTTDGTNNKFKACCTCLYGGGSTINLYGSGTAPTSRTPTPAPAITPGSTTQQNVLALDDAEYNRNSIILIALVTPMAVLLVGSLAGNVLMTLKLRQGAAAGSGYNVRAGDVELSTSPRARVDV